MILSFFACDLHKNHMPTQSITSCVCSSPTQERKQTTVRVREVRDEEQQLCVDSIVCFSFTFFLNLDSLKSQKRYRVQMLKNIFIIVIVFIELWPIVAALT